jgi:hypothetical protein
MSPNINRNIIEQLEEVIKIVDHRFAGCDFENGDSGQDLSKAIGILETLSTILK